ncbi:uncharacterized protein LOC128231656 [Mya arenaria]|uniref:uncharacterized protein LOC128231656 n=1 Tax=Mya arenaria TaxID=6604 RepID=UPI0022E62EF6|nr:uncharacterized protein LOC128231656 [Mya arenaria]
MAIVKGKKKATDIPECPYGARCYRKNPQHFIDFFHPKKAKTSDTESNSDSGTDATDGPSTSSVSKLPTTDDSSLPPCKYGAKCYRKNLMHFAEFSHPTTVVASVQKSDSGSDTDEISDEDDKDSVKKDVKTSDILKRGMSLVKSYSQMTEAERKELIKKAFEAKQKLQEELAETKAEVKKKDEELSNLQKQVTTGFLLMEGEKEALEGSDVKYFELFPERSYKEGSAAQMHFRLAESQFYRLLSGSSIKLTKVEYVVNPDLVEHFKLCRENLKKTRGEDCSYPVLAFHGTTEQNIPLICKDGFKIPGDSGHKHRTDTGWYGKGVYFSEYPSYSMGYIAGSQKMLLCQVLPGKAYQCTKLIHGASLMKGHDSHVSPCKKELVIFNKFHILPQYIVHYKQNVGEFQYDAVPDKKAGLAKKIASAAAVGVGKVKAALTGKGTKKKGGKLSIDDLTDSALMANKHAKAMNMPASKALSGYKVQFTGVFMEPQAGCQALATKHGAQIGTKAVFNLLVAGKGEFDSQTSKVIQANKKGVPIVGEMFMYDCIINKKKLDESNYSLED